MAWGEPQVQVRTIGPSPEQQRILEAGPTLVRFKVECSLTKPGQCVYIVGSLPELGAWDPARALVCETSAEAFPMWTSAEQRLSLHGQDQRIEFKVLVQGAQNLTKKKLGLFAGAEQARLAEQWAGVKAQWAEHLEGLKETAESDSTVLAPVMGA